MPNYSRGDVLLVRYPFTDLSGVKVRPASVTFSFLVFLFLHPPSLVKQLLHKIFFKKSARFLDLDPLIA